MVAKVDVQVFDVTIFLVPEARAENEFEQICFLFSSHVEHRLKLFGFVDGTDDIDVLGPVTLLHEADTPMPLEELQHSHHLVIDSAFAQTPLIAEGHKVQNILPSGVLNVLLLVGGAK